MKTSTTEAHWKKRVVMSDLSNKENVESVVVTTNKSNFMPLLAPLKKRRGRPPKYLSVWQESYLQNQQQQQQQNQVNVKSTDVASNQGDEEIDNKSDTSDLPASPISSTESDQRQMTTMTSAASPDQQPPPLFNLGLSTTSNVTSPGSHTGPRQSTPMISRVNGAFGDSDTSDLSSSCNSTLSSPMLSSSSSSSVSQMDISSDSAIHSSDNSASENTSKQPPELLSNAHQREAASPVSVIVDLEPTSAPAQTSVEDPPVVCSKKKPSRPLATAAVKPRRPSDGNDGGKKRGQDAEFRRFYEAGGRDYNEYLEWLKSRKAQQPGLEQRLKEGPPQLKPVSQAQPTISHPATTAVNVLTSAVDTPSLIRIPQNILCFPRTVSTSGAPKSVSAPPPYRPYLSSLTSSTTSATTPTVSSFARPSGQQRIIAPVVAAKSNQHGQNGVSPDGRSAATSISHLSTSPILPQATAIPLVEQRAPPPYSALDLSSKKRRSTEMAEIAAIKRSRPEQNNNYLELQTDCNGNLKPANRNYVDWDVDDVARFLTSLSWGHEYIEVFKEQCIDGATLPYLSEDHLLNVVKMKLGHAIKLRVAVKRLQQLAQ